MASRAFAHAPMGDVREIGVHVYTLSDGLGNQLSLLGDELMREQHITWAIDDINARWGERTIHVASTLDTGPFMQSKIPFGSTRYL